MRKFEDLSHTEDEQNMSRVHLQKIIENAEKIIECLPSMGNDIPAWVQDKISVSNHSMDAISTWCDTNEVSEGKNVKEKMKYLKKFETYHCNCGCEKCGETTINNLKPISESLLSHIDGGEILTENVFRYGSEAYFNLINEARDQYLLGNIELSETDKEIIKTDIGKKGVYEGKEVWLDIPMEDEEPINETKFKGKDVKTNKPSRDSSGGKAYKVHVTGCVNKTDSNPSGIKLVRFGSGGLKAKINDADAKKRYDSRHGCSKGKHNDKCKAGYWSCRLPRYAKALGLSGGGKWW